MSPSPLSHYNGDKRLNLVGVCKAEANHRKNDCRTVETWRKVRNWEKASPLSRGNSHHIPLSGTCIGNWAKAGQSLRLARSLDCTCWARRMVEAHSLLSVSDSSFVGFWLWLPVSLGLLASVPRASGSGVWSAVSCAKFFWLSHPFDRFVGLPWERGNSVTATEI